VTRGAAFGAALLVAIGRPAWWAMALATFLLRGGIVVVILPIVTLPSALALSNAFAPLLLPLALGRIEPAIVAGPATIVAVLLLWLVGGGRVAAAIDVALVREAAGAALEEGVADGPEPSAADAASEAGADTTVPALPPPRRSTSGLAWRVLALRLIAWLPLALAIGFGIASIVQVTYAELTRPADVASPLVTRVARQVVGQVALIVIAWIVGEVVGGVATRRAVLGRGGYGASLASAVRTSARRPLSWLVPWLGTTAVLVLVMGGALVAAALAWARVVDALADRSTEAPAAYTTLAIFVALWLAAMFLGGVVLAVRSASQTFEHVRLSAAAGASASRRRASAAAAPGTFGASAHRRPGDWSADDEGGSL
jgi:hypothetical protein